MTTSPTAEIPAVSAEDLPFKTKPYPHQIKALDYVLQKPRFALLMEMGLGKTKVIVDLHSCLVGHGETAPFLIVCPKSLIYNWEKEYKTHKFADIRPVGLVGSKAQKLKLLKAALEVKSAVALLINYEGIDNLYDELRKIQYAAMVLDESTKIKNHRSRRTKQCKILAKRSSRAYILTGNVTPNSPLDVYAQFNFLDPQILGYYSFFTFKSRYSIMGGWKGKEIVSFVNLKEMSERIGQASYRLMKEEVLPDLPAKQYHTIEVELHGEQKTAYEQMRESALMEIREHHLAAPVVLAKLTRLSQIAGGFVKDNQDKKVVFKPNSKLDALIDVIKSLPAKKKFIIWARFIPELEAIHRILLEMGFTSALFYGQTSYDDRRSIVQNFQDSNNPLQVIVGQMETGGYGHTLTQAWNVIYYSNSYSYGDRVQSEDRAHRIGLDHPVFYTDIIARSTIDRAIQAALKMKKDLGQMVSGQDFEEMI